MNILLMIVILPFAAALLMARMGGSPPRVRAIFMRILSAFECALCAFAMIKPTYCHMYWFGAGWGLLYSDGFQGVLAAFASVLWFLASCLPNENIRSDRESRHHCASLITFGATLGLFLSGDLMTAFVFFEMMSFSSYMLVAANETERAKLAARNYLAVSLAASMVSLAGLYLLYHTSGTFLISSLPAAAEKLRQSGLLTPCAAMIAAGFAAKAGMFPLNVWLPDAYTAAPTPATILFSSVLSKVGVFYLLILSATLIAGSAALSLVLLALGAATMLWGGLQALFSDDLKRTVAYSSMSQIGFMLIGVFVYALSGEAIAAIGTAAHMLNHGVLKFVLFACAGIIASGAGTSTLSKLKGAGRGNPLLFICLLTAALGLSGVPGLSGYISKTLLHESIAEYALAAPSALYRNFSRAIEWLFIGAGGLTFAYMLKLLVVLFAPKREDTKPNHIPAWTAVALVASTLMIPLFGLYGGKTLIPLAETAAVYSSLSESAAEIAFFSFQNTRSAAISLAFGALFYALYRLWLNRAKRPRKELGLLNIVYIPLLNRVILKAMHYVFSALDKIPALILAFLRRMVFNKDDERTSPPGDDHFAAYSDEPRAQGVFSETLSYSFLLIGLGVAIALLYLLFH